MFHQTILNLDDISFLKAVVSAYPETKYMLDNTLESASARQARESNLAYQIFNADEIQDTAEFNRAAVGLLCLKYVLTGNYEAFTACQNPAVRLSQDTFRRLQDWTNQIIQTETDFNTAIYAIMCNDLGKTKFATRLYQAETGHSNADHDAILSYLLTHRKDMFSGFISLPTQIQVANYPHTQNIQNILPSGKSVYIGIGGGSDVVQAAQVATIAEKPIACIISVRADKTQSQGDKNTQIGMKRTVENHGGEVVPNVYRIRPETIGNGRFMENIPTQTGAPVYLVLDSGNGQLSYQIESAIKDAGGAENIVCIDTGGDCLYLAQNDANSTAKATPDQDYATLKAVHQLSGYRKFSCVLATGVDAPDYADEVLSTAQAQFATLSPKQAETLLQNYQKWGMDGSTQSIIGKTPLALQNALRHKEGLTVLDLPERVVTDKNNPWNPFVVMTEPMRFIAVMDLDKHFNAVVPIKNNQNTVQKYVQMKQNTRS